MPPDDSEPEIPTYYLVPQSSFQLKSQWDPNTNVDILIVFIGRIYPFHLE
jgi:hypothetical protein